VAGATFGVREVRIRGFRSARSVSFTPGPVCALVGGPSVGKSNVLAAIWMLLQRGAPAPAAGDVSAGGSGAIHLSATLGDGDEIALEANPPASPRGTGQEVAVLLMPASLRSGGLLAAPARTIVLAPDFEAVADLRGHRHKPARAWQRFSRIEPAEVPRAFGGGREGRRAGARVTRRLFLRGRRPGHCGHES
jgi:hypothetical protein